MPDPIESANQPVASNNNTNDKNEVKSPKIVVCAETKLSTARIIPHAIALSNALDIEVQLVHVIEPSQDTPTPLDPLEWDLRRREAEAFVQKLSKQYQSKSKTILTHVLQGRLSDKICSCLVDNEEDFVVLCRSDAETTGHIGHTVRQVLEKAVNSLLIVPAVNGDEMVANYKRILVPLDGSARAESALSIAKKIAHANNATIVIIHAIPDLMGTAINPLDNEYIELRDNMHRRNERVAKDYLNRIHENISASGATSNYVIVSGRDVRRQLNDAIVAESIDLLILSSHGQSGHTDVPTGDITSYLIANSNVPILMVRRHNHNGHSRGAHFYKNVDPKGLRQPNGASY